MSAQLMLDSSEFDKILQAATHYAGSGAEDAINDVIHGAAGEVLFRNINPLIHPSGRTFKGHSSSATAAMWPRYDTSENLAVTIAPKGKQRYLYFPDDGSNTKRHAGQQEFFLRGGKSATPEIADLIIAALVKEWEDS